jgi:hypothetical protein
MNPDDLWAITCYFNPARYTSRYSNYKVFQERLGVPLLSTELVYGGVPQLGERDADRLIQLTGKDVLWQKERLLNVALDALPPSCRFVVWIDCDVVFENPDWALETREVLKRTRLVQPHGRVFDLRPGTALDDIDRGAVLWERESMARKYCRGAIDFGATSASMLREYSPGHAWAARRDLLARVGFYDPMILGSGDFIMAMAAIGRYQDIEGPYQMNQRQAEHYLEWAVRYHEVIEGNLGVVEGTLLHLWHGDLVDRGYDVRYQGLKAYDFDPFSDLAVDESGCWRWNSNKPELHQYVRQYFARRREDG